MHQRRDDAVGVELQVFGRVVLELAEVEVVALVGDALFLEAQPRLARTGGHPGVVQLEHCVSPVI